MANRCLYKYYYQWFWLLKYSLRRFRLVERKECNCIFKAITLLKWSKPIYHSTLLELKNISVFLFFVQVYLANSSDPNWHYVTLTKGSENSEVLSFQSSPRGSVYTCEKVNRCYVSSKQWSSDVGQQHRFLRFGLVHRLVCQDSLVQRRV